MSERSCIVHEHAYSERAGRLCNLGFRASARFFRRQDRMFAVWPTPLAGFLPPRPGEAESLRNVLVSEAVTLCERLREELREATRLEA